MSKKYSASFSFFTTQAFYYSAPVLAYPLITPRHGDNMKNQKIFVAGKGTYNVMARAWWANMFHISRNKFRKRPMPSWVWPPVTIRNGMHIHAINSWFEPKKSIKAFRFSHDVLKAKSEKCPTPWWKFARKSEHQNIDWEYEDHWDVNKFVEYIEDACSYTT